MPRAARAAEIVNADAMQLYRGMDIGTAKLPLDERRGIPHHLIDVLDVTDEAAVAWYQEAARAAIGGDPRARCRRDPRRRVWPVRVECRLRLPLSAARRRAACRSSRPSSPSVGPGVLFARLREADPVTAARIDPKNGRRIVRALEVLAQGAATHGAALPDAPVLWYPDTRIIGVATPRDELVPRLDARVERMWADGLVDEVAALRAKRLEAGRHGPARHRVRAGARAAQRAISSEAEAIAETQALTRRYARRQVSWFKRYRRDPVGRFRGGCRAPGRLPRMSVDIRPVRPRRHRRGRRPVARWPGLTRPWNDPHRDIERKLAVQPELFLVAVDAGAVVGSVMAGYDGHRGWLYYLATVPRAAARASPGRSSAAAEERLLAMGCPKVQLMVRPDNEAARGFYDAIGYEPFDTWATGKRLIAATDTRRRRVGDLPNGGRMRRERLRPPADLRCVGSRR